MQKVTDEHLGQILDCDAICLDVDSTVIQDEGIDLLANICGVDISEVTNRAMGGSMTFRQALTLRLNAMKPTQSQVAQAEKLPLRLTPGIAEFVTWCKLQGKVIFLISGGFYSFIEPIADALCVPKENIFANRLHFDFHGRYVGFDTNEPTSESHGKTRVMDHIKETLPLKRLIHFGDGATDLETKEAIDLFVAYIGVQRREKVVARADCVISDFRDLLKNLEGKAKL